MITKPKIEPAPVPPRLTQAVTLLWGSANGAFHVDRISLDGTLKALHSTRGST